MKTLLMIIALSFMGLTPAHAGDRCNAATGNWVNAAKTTCPPLDARDIHDVQGGVDKKCDRKS